jgi:hypothetical protein
MTTRSDSIDTEEGSRSGVTRPRALFLALAAGAVALWGASCAATPDWPSDGRESFTSADAAVDALVGALRAFDPDRLEEILGPEGRGILESGDDVEDRGDIQTFLDAYDGHHEIVHEEDTYATLEVGDDAWEMPIPIVLEDGAWYFDTEAGLDEILARRIGDNELTVIQVCRAIVDAQHDYAQLMTPDAKGVRVYAERFLSRPGLHDGLYWETKEGEPESPLGPLVADAEEEGYTIPEEGRRSFHGYYFKMLTSQGSAAPGGARSFMIDGHMIGGFGVLAWPAGYDNSGIMSFLVSDDGILYQKDLGPDTATIAGETSVFDPGPGWEIVPE